MSNVSVCSRLSYFVPLSLQRSNLLIDTDSGVTMTVCIWCTFVCHAMDHPMEHRSYRISAHVHICKIGSIFSQRSMITDSLLHWFATWFVIDIATFRSYRGEVISTIWLDHLYCTWLNKSISAVLCNMDTMRSTYVRTLCPCCVTCNILYNKFKIRNFYEIWDAVQLAW